MLKPILKNDGVNESERQLSKLLNDTFLSLWSYIGPYSNEGTAKNKQGKEICDAIVVFGNKVLIFSDKEIKFNEEKSIEVAWKRWYKKSITNSVRQLHAAEAWIRNYPNRVFLDNFCQEPFPLDLNDKRLEIHLIAITKNTFNPAKKYFDNIEIGSTGSLAYSYALKEKDVLERPFFLCDIDPKKTFVHIFDEFSIHLVLNELSTISDFINYLKVKEKLVRNKGLNCVYGEEDLLGYYLNDKEFLLGRTQFNYPDSNCEDNLNILEGYWNLFQESENFEVHNNLKDMSSYWSELTARLSDCIVSAEVGEGQNIPIAKHEILLRSMASETMVDRAYLGHSFQEKFEKVPSDRRSARVLQSPSKMDKFYVFLFLPFDINENLEEHTKRRAEIARAYGLVLKYKQSIASSITVIVTQPKGSYYRSEAIYLFECHKKLTFIQNRIAEKLIKNYSILREFTDYKVLSNDHESKLKIKWGRNHICYCGSGKKYKKCCLNLNNINSRYT
ncbi:SEC-C metal-binding domain-containing protein [Acinetobacter lactucae]|uniref:SEC-C metal-binding domain-containing protein n=1 Tax=Acinetobacter lactucae TaxID=1785128 RepID=UPI0003DFAAC5|nr:SEC-C metal-binding domain-containing protein [Acinetobacter lactucae]ETR94887.1 SEC-C motif family protein [Acinetobacter lactucae]